jgi:hypothetical protein
VFGRLQADTVAAVWTAAAAIHREKNTVEAAAAAGLQPQQAAANKPFIISILNYAAATSLQFIKTTHTMLTCCSSISFTQHLLKHKIYK